ncbi:MAG TPA: hypothetical protein VFN23_20750, partial [Ktedonobacteraceae bacterium]|nr:hypothetical protein [Ktedonobacteraceae bacterium]
EFAGTVSYMAPEQLEGKPRPASDQYSLGVIVYQWLCGELPFSGSFTEIASQHVLIPPPSLSERVSGLPIELERVVFTALAKDSQERFASVTAFAEAFENVSRTIDPARMSLLPAAYAGSQIEDLSTINGVTSTTIEKTKTSATVAPNTDQPTAPIQSPDPKVTPNITSPILPAINTEETKESKQRTEDNEYATILGSANEQKPTPASQQADEQASTPASQPGTEETEEASPDDAETLFDKDATTPVKAIAKSGKASTLTDKNDDYKTILAADPHEQEANAVPETSQEAKPDTNEEAEPEASDLELEPKEPDDQQAQELEDQLDHQSTKLIHDPNYTIDTTERPTITMAEIEFPANIATSKSKVDISERSTVNINNASGRPKTTVPPVNHSKPAVREVSLGNNPPQSVTNLDTAHAAGLYPAASFSSMQTSLAQSPAPHPPDRKDRTRHNKKNAPSVQPPVQIMHPYFMPGTPLPPGYILKPAKRRRSGLPFIVILLLLLLLMGSAAGLFYFNPGKARAIVQQIIKVWAAKPSVTATPKAVVSSKVTITLTLPNTTFKNTFGITAVPGTPDSTKDQVSARLLQATSPMQSQTTTITVPSTIPGKQADGILQLVNPTSSPIQLAAGTTYTSTSGIQIVIDPATTVPALQSITVNAHAASTGLTGNIPALDLNTCLNQGNPPPLTGTGSPTPGTVTSIHSSAGRHQLQNIQVGQQFLNLTCTGSGTIQNPVAFSGGVNDTSAKIVKQKDIDSATRALNDQLLTGIQKQFQAQVQDGENIDGDPQCQQAFTQNHNVGDLADSVTVKGTITCLAETYNLSAANDLARLDLQNSIDHPNANGGYQLVGQIDTSLVSVSAPDANNAIKLNILAQGIWNYQISDSKKQAIIQSILGKNPQDAQNILITQNGVSKATITGAGNLLPEDPKQIILVINTQQ